MEGLESSLGWSSLVGIVEASVDRFALEAQGVAPKQIRNSYVLLPKHSQRLQNLCGASVVVRFPSFCKYTLATCSLLGWQSDRRLIERYSVLNTGAHRAPRPLGLDRDGFEVLMLRGGVM